VAIAEFYDAVMIYGSPEVFDPIRAYGLGPAIAAKVHFTGYLMTSYLVDPASHVRQELGLDPHTRLAICTLGGGGDGARVAATFLEAMIVLRDKGWHGVLVTGPYMPEHDRERLQATESVTVVGFVADVPSYLAAADAVLSMGGYNTLCEALSVNAPVVVVPRVEPRLEQLIRAEAFAARGLVRVVHPEELSASRVAEQLLLASGDDAQSRRRSIEALGGSGVENAAAHLSRLLQLSAAAVPQMSGRGGR
jgi:predicted glycosyltransferase